LTDHPDESPTKDAIDVECNPNIRRLTVRTGRSGILPQLASYLKYLLSRLSAPNIQQITIVVPLWSREDMDWGSWSEVDQVLDGIKFRGLREVAIVVNTYRVESIRRHLTDQFPAMFDRGILDIRMRTSLDEIS
jgi:hypothetical protein